MPTPLTLSDVPNATPYIQYIASSGQTVFPYPFPITQDSNLIVVVNGVTLATDAGYTLSGQGDDTGGNLTFTSGRTVGDIVTLFRDIPIERISQIAQNSGFSSTVFNAEFNNIYLIMQQLEAGISQCLQIPNTNNPAPTTLLDPTSYANKYLSFDANGNPVPAAITSSGALTAAIIGGLLYPRTAAEISLGYTPTNYAYPADPYVDPRRYGADPTGTNDSTGAVQKAIDVAYECSGTVWIGNGCNYKCSALSKTFSGNRQTDGLRITGSGRTGSALTLSGALTMVGADPTSAPQESNFVLENLTLYGTSSSDGLVLDSVSYWRVSNVVITSFDRNVYLHGALVGTIENSGIFSGNTGIYCDREGTVIGVNLVHIKDSVINLNSTLGIDFVRGDRLKLTGCDLEGNGTASDNDTGAVMIRSTAGFATGFASVDIDGCWFESNSGVAVQTESVSGLILAIRNTNWYSDVDGNSLIVAGGRLVSIADSMAPSGSAALWDITCSNLHLKNVLVHSLTDSADTSIYENVNTSAGRVTHAQADVPFTFEGSVTAAASTATTVQAIPAASGSFAVYLATATIAGTDDPANYNATSIVTVNQNTAAIASLKTAALMTLSLSGLDLQATQGSGASATVSYWITRIA